MQTRTLSTLSQMMADRRAILGHSKAAAAREIGVGRAATSRWERGEAVPDIAQYPAIARYLGISPLEVRDIVEASPTVDVLEDQSPQWGEL